jgi:tetratricopeptide (TPR) repeat protein
VDREERLSMGYWSYYAVWLVLAYFEHNPWLIAPIALFFLLRPVLPDPWVWMRTYSRIRRLRRETAANPANVTARRDLARLYLELRRPKAALVALDEARARHPKDAELLYLTGVARLRSGDAEGALEPIVACVEEDPRLLFGEPYRVAADALERLGRLEEAEDALERYTSHNSSSIEAHTRLASVRSRRGDKEGARAALREALSTWGQIPWFRRRREVKWWLIANVARLWT